VTTGGELSGSAREKIGSGYEFKQFEMRNAFIHDRPHSPPMRSINGILSILIEIRDLVG
jgi:hypothetical protein